MKLQNKIKKISQISDNIYLGPAEHPMDQTEEFKELNIDVIINCASEVNYPSSIMRHFLISNDKDTTLLDDVNNIIELIDSCIAGNKKIYIHSTNSTSRAPAVLICYYMMRDHLDFFQAFDFIRKKRRVIEIHDNFTNELRSMSEI